MAYGSEPHAYTEGRERRVHSLRVLHVLAAGEYGGAEAQVLALCKSLQADGIHVLIAVSVDAEFAQKAREAGLAIVRIAGRHPFEEARAIARVALDAQVDVIHTHGVRASVAGRLAGRQLGIPVVTTVHSDLYYDYASAAKRTVFMALERLTRRWSAKVIAVSEAILRVLRDRGYPESQLVLVGNGVDIALCDSLLEAAHRAPLSLRRQLGISDDALLVVCAARLHPVKRHDVLIEGFARVPAMIESRPVHLLLAGEGSERQAIENAIAAHTGLADRVHLLGVRTDVLAILAEADVFALTSQMEGLPISVLEAMIAQLPVVASRVGGLREVVVDASQSDDATGLLFPVGDVEALGRALTEVLSDPELRKELGANALHRVRTRYGLAQSTARTAAIYALLTGDSHPGSM
ncbi:MAG: glycosyltransferase [Firmicutes bacterium]|nr:glycosyltransferase [Bacillota bacterium]